MSSNPGVNGRRPWSIALRLSVWYAAAAFALVLVATGYLYFALVRNLDREDDQFLADKAATVRRVTDDRKELRREVADIPDRLFVRVSVNGEGSVETPGMSGVLPSRAFPDLESKGPTEQTAEFRAGNGRSYRVLTSTGPDHQVLIHVAMDTSHDDELLEDYRRHLSYVLGLSLFAAVLGGYWIARHGLRPIADATATARRIGPTRLDERIATAGLPAEVSEFADTFNHALVRLEDAFARLGRFTADIAHELRTPVNNLRGEIEVAIGRPRTPEEYREVLGSCLEECGRLTRLIDSLLFLARAEDPKTQLATEPVDVAAELAAVREFYDPAAAEGGVKLGVEAGPGLVARADRQLLQRAVGNLVANALAHTPAGGAVTLFAARDPAGVRLGVRDTGPGIPAEHLPLVFERFYRAGAARSAGRVGLGLAIVKGIAELHGGSAAAVSQPGGGTTVTLVIPANEG
jgi:two-component system heavy metal sensor histidine kinase CusS